MRTSPDAEPTTIPRETWRFTDETHVAVDGGFKPFHWYELVYRTSLAPVAGCGLLAIRDIVSHLRTDGIDHTFAYGVSQSGRLLRQFLSEGLNLDEAGMPVFDGVFSDFASAATRRVQPPLRAAVGRADHRLRRTSARSRHADLLARQRELGGVPKTIFTNSASEYWHGDGALLHVDPFTGKDLPEDPDVRTYLIAGTDHFGSSKLKECAARRQPGAPPGRHARESGTAGRAGGLGDAMASNRRPARCRGPATAPRSPARKCCPVFSHVAAPDLASLPYDAQCRPRTRRRSRHRPLAGAAGGVVRRPGVGGRRDGNEVAGIRLPAVAAPLAAYTGWNPSRAHRASCPTCFTSGSAASLRSRRDGRRSPRGIRLATTTQLRFARPPNRLSPRGSCSRTRSTRS